MYYNIISMYYDDGRRPPRGSVAIGYFLRFAAGSMYMIFVIILSFCGEEKMATNGREN